jgi:hypothetical protein
VVLLDETASLRERLNTFDYEFNRTTMERDQQLVAAYHDQLVQGPRTHLSAAAVAQLKSCTEIGWLYKRGERNTQWKRRWFELKNYTLKYSANPADETPKGEIIVTTVEGTGDVPSDTQHEFLFHLKSETRVYVLAADSEAEKLNWLQKIARTREIIVQDVNRD